MQELEMIQKTLDFHSKILADIQKKLLQIEISLNEHNSKIKALSKKSEETIDEVSDLTNVKNGVIRKILDFQASCPRKQIKYIWLVLIPTIISQISLTVFIIKELLRI